MNDDKINMELLDWIESRDFGMLSDSEKELVLEAMTKAEYTVMRKTFLTSKERLGHFPETLKVNKEMSADIFARAKAKQKAAPSGWKKIFLYRVPAWQAAAATVLVATAFYFWGAAPKPVKASGSTSFVADTMMGISLEEDSVLSSFMVESL